MTSYHYFALTLMISLIEKLHSFEIIRTSPVVVRTATSYSDYIDIICHKNRALVRGHSIRPDHQHHSITNMMADSNQKHFMAFVGNIVVGCTDLITLSAGELYHVQNVVVSRDYRRCGVATALLDSVGEYVASEKSRLIHEKKCWHREAILELDVDRSNLSAKALYIKNGYFPRFSWGNLLNHRQKMYKLLKVNQVASQSTPISFEAQINTENSFLNYGI